MTSPRKVLILCTGNSCRSQMAEELWNTLAAGEWSCFSAGSRPAGYVHEMAIQAMQETGSEWNIMTADWVLTWKWTAEGWKIKARLCLRGFQDRQGSTVHKYSPTASRLAQRLLLSTAAIYLWEVISIDISAGLG